MSARFKTWPILLSVCFLISATATPLIAESTIPPPGIREHTPRVHALTNARIVTAPGEIIERGTLVIRDGNIVAVGANARIPADALTWDLNGKTIYPGLIDLYSDYGMPGKKGAPPGAGARPVAPGPPTGTPYWNPRVTPQHSAAELFSFDRDGAEKLRSQGVTLTLAIPPGDIVSGTAALVNTGEGPANDLVIRPEAALHISFRVGRWGDEYPGSLMGLIALLRQSYADADWYMRALAAWREEKSFARPEVNEALAKLAALKASGVPVLMDASDEQAVLREVKLAAELGLTPIMYGSNYEYRRLDAVKGTGVPFVLPLDFPEVPSVKTPEEALDVTLGQLRHWYLAPENARRLHDAGVTIAFTSDGLKDRGKFLGALRNLVDRGLDPKTALTALTTAPASIMGVSDRYGTLAVGKAADFVVTDGDLFDSKTRVMETWVDGNRYVVETDPPVDPRGTWNLTLSSGIQPGDTVTLDLKGKAGAPSGSISKGAKVDLGDVRMSGARLSFTFQGDSLGFAGVVRMSANVEPDRMLGDGSWPDGRTFTWAAQRVAAFTPEPDTTAKEEPEPLPLPALYPDGAFGRTAPPAQPKLIAFTNAKLWTSGPQGIIEKGTLLVANGKIAGVGANVKVPGDAVVVDATGLQITSGIIDCHSHTAIDGDVNESNQTITAEVRIGDVVDANDISLYRELAGGLTIANLLHGSANAIGGENQVVKLRWGATPEGLKFKAAPPGIKFALGENPKQSNWGDQYTSRYPQSRLGVEEIIRDEFQAAREYEQIWRDYDKKGPPPRRDLELETMVQVLHGDRLVHCHAYRQDEIEMLMRLAEEYGFKIATFQHVLEGYKVADQMAAHGAAGSCFSDWWAYKFEVYDAIPYNGALMHDQGVVVSFNSDSNELARRLNTEAAKAMKYGGLSPEEALKFVTINPARQLRIDDRVGSLEPGKDADFVLWSGDPLSTYSICLQTWIDGRKYFDREEDSLIRERDNQERALLIQRALKAGGGKGGAKPWPKKPDYSCIERFEKGERNEAR